MGPYQDVDITIGSSVNRRIQYTTVGTAPNRKWVLSFYQIPLFSLSGVCNSRYQNTSQIILNESTGIIEVNVFSKEQCPNWNLGRAMIGIQNAARTIGLVAPGRAASDPAWGTINMNEGWQFIPSSGAPLFKRVELYNLAGVLQPVTPTVNPLGDGTMEVLFPGLCPPAGATTAYIVKSVYQRYDNPALEVAGYDTIRVVRTAATDLSATASSTVSACGVSGTGSVSIQVPVGVGVAPFNYSITGAGGPFQPGNVFTNVAAGNYTAYVADAGGCTSTIPVTVASNGVMAVSFVTNPTSCPGAPNGSVTVNANGIAPIQYRINFGPWVTTNTFTGLVPGTYFFDILDATGCHADLQSATVTSGTGTVTGTAAGTATSCSGVNNGIITITPTSGSGPYQYSLNGTTWQNSNVFTGLAPGNYNALIREAGLCTSLPIPVNIAQGNGLQVSLTSSATSCTGVNNGTVTVTPGNGISPFTVSIDGGGTKTVPSPIVFTNVSAGSHTITITDAAGCTASAPLTINVATGTGYTALSTITATSCAGASNGSIAINPQAPGTAPFTFVLTPGNVTRTGATTTYTNLAAGSYSILVTDANGCQFTLNNQVVTQGAGLQGSLTNTSTTCNGVNNGTITVTPTTGTAPFVFLLDGTVSLGGNTSATFTGLSAGAHTVSITDANGCTTITPLSTNITTGTGYTASFTTSPTSCSGVNDGSVSVSAQAPGTAPFSFLLNPGAISHTGALTTVFTGLAPGGYTVLVTDANGCQYTVTNINVAQGAGLIANLLPTATSCTGINNGTLTVNTNGTGPFTFILDGTVTQTSTTNTTLFTNLAAGSHSVTVRDASGCVTPTPVSATINVGAGFTATQTSTPATCAGVSNASLTISVGTGGTSPYSFMLNGVTTQTGASGTIFTNLPAGNANNVLVTDAAGCTFTLANIVITQPTALSATTTIQGVKCNGGTDGQITVNATGGTAPYRYAIGAAPLQASNVFTVPTGTYSVTVQDANNCSINLNNILVTQPAVLGASIVSTSNASCDGGNDGTIVVAATGGTTNYEYSVDGINFQSAATLRVAPGTYTITVRDANNCTTQVPNVVVGLTNNLVLTPMTDPAPICEGTGTTLQPITNATVFSWTPVTGLSNASAGTLTASPTNNTLYTVTATLGRCSTTDDVLVTVLPAPVPNAGTGGTICYGQSFQLHASGAVSYSWTPVTYLNNTLIANPEVVTPIKTTTYSLNVVDANNCASLVPDQVTVTVTPPIKVFVSPADTVVYAGAQFQLNAYSAAPIYTWTPAAGLSDPTVSNPIVMAPAVGDRLDYQVVARTPEGCRGEAYVTIRVYKGPEIYVANAFSPNNDGKNELFMPVPVGIKSLNYFRVFNRWGQLLYSTTTLHAGWDGRFAGVEQATGVYVWMIQGVTEDGKLISRQGNVTLIR